jgi:hypothetical protein
MSRKRSKTPITYMDKKGKQSKLYQTITFNLEFKFWKTNNPWKGIEEEKKSIHPKFLFGNYIFLESNKAFYVATSEWRIAACKCCNVLLRTHNEAWVQLFEFFLREECI